MNYKTVTNIKEYKEGLYYLTFNQQGEIEILAEVADEKFSLISLSNDNKKRMQFRVEYMYAAFYDSLFDLVKWIVEGQMDRPSFHASKT